MASFNSLLGGPVQDTSAPYSAPTAGDDLGESLDTAGPDGTEWGVAVLVLGALGTLVLFKIAGFQAVIAASASVGS